MVNRTLRLIAMRLPVKDGRTVQSSLQTMSPRAVPKRYKDSSRSLDNHTRDLNNRKLRPERSFQIFDLLHKPVHRWKNYNLPIL